MLAMLANMNWPCVIRHPDDVELILVRNEQEWINLLANNVRDLDDSNTIIDSLGHIHTLAQDENENVFANPTGETMLLNDFLGLVKAHAAQAGSCCVAKLYAPSFAAAFDIIVSLED